VSADVSAEPADLAEGRARWRKAVAGVLAKSTRRDAEELGPEPERLLDSPTYEGFAIRPLYTALDELPEPPLPGEYRISSGSWTFSSTTSVAWSSARQSVRCHSHFGRK